MIDRGSEYGGRSSASGNYPNSDGIGSSISTSTEQVAQAHPYANQQAPGASTATVAGAVFNCGATVRALLKPRAYANRLKTDIRSWKHNQILIFYTGVGQQDRTSSRSAEERKVYWSEAVAETQRCLGNPDLPSERSCHP